MIFIYICSFLDCGAHSELRRALNGVGADEEAVAKELREGSPTDWVPGWPE